MKNKIKGIISHIYDRDSDARNMVAAVQLEKLFDEEILLFLSFLRENYSREKWDNNWKDWVAVPHNKYNDCNTDEELSTEEILKIWKQKSEAHGK